MAHPGSGGPWKWRTLGVAAPGSGGPLPAPHLFIRTLGTLFVRYEILTTICSVLHANYSSTVDCDFQLSLVKWITWSGFLIQTNQTVNHFSHRLLPRPSCHRCLLRHARL